MRPGRVITRKESCELAKKILLEAEERRRQCRDNDPDQWCGENVKKDFSSKWDNRFLELAKFISQWSKDPSTKVGAVIIDERFRIVSVGYNGLPAGIEDSAERLENREMKYGIVIHGELNAIWFAQRDLTGCTLYTYPFMPCSSCASVIIQVGIKRCVAPVNDNPRWNDSFDLTKTIFKEAGVELVLIEGGAQ